MGELHMNKWRKLISSTILGLALVVGTPAAVPLQGTVTEVQAAVTKPAVPKMISVTSSGKKKITVKWKPVKEAAGYQIYRKLPGKQWSLIKTLGGASRNTYSDTAVTTRKQYCYTVKAYKKSSGKIITGSGDRRSFTTVAGLQYVKINKSRADIYNGKTTTIKLTGTTARPTWKSSNTKIATVSSKGVVTGKKAGTVNITATLCGRKFTCKVTVKNSSLSNTALKNNYTKFKNYINKHGVRLNGTTTKYISYKDGTTEIGVGYIPKTDKVNLFTVVVSQNTSVGTDVLINCTKTKNGTAQISIFSNDGTMVLKATLCPATFRKTTTLKFYANGKLVTGELAKSSNDLVKATIEGANEVMKSTMKMTVRDIGFYVF